MLGSCHVDAFPISSSFWLSLWRREAGALGAPQETETTKGSAGQPEKAQNIKEVQQIMPFFLQSAQCSTDFLADS